MDPVGGFDVNLGNFPPPESIQLIIFMNTPYDSCASGVLGSFPGLCPLCLSGNYGSY